MLVLEKAIGMSMRVAFMILYIPYKHAVSFPMRVRSNENRKHLCENHFSPAQKVEEFQAFLHEFSGSGDLPISEQRFFDPYVAYTGKASKNRSPRSLNVFDTPAQSTKIHPFLDAN